MGRCIRGRGRGREGGREEEGRREEAGDKRKADELEGGNVGESEGRMEGRNEMRVGVEGKKGGNDGRNERRREGRSGRGEEAERGTEIGREGERGRKGKSTNYLLTCDMLTLVTCAIAQPRCVTFLLLFPSRFPLVYSTAFGRCVRIYPPAGISPMTLC